MAVDMVDGGATHLAANLFPVLTLFVRGGARARFAGGSQSTSHRLFLRGPFMAARQKLFFPVVALSPHFGIGQRHLERRVLETFGVSLRDIRWVARVGMSLPPIALSSIGVTVRYKLDA
jgi:hypothetical protein